MLLARSSDRTDEIILDAIRGIVFFGVPSSGMDIRSLKPMVGDGPNRALVEALDHVNSQVLSNQQREFPAAFRKGGQKDIVFFYETSMSPTASQSNAGAWTMDGPETAFVPRALPSCSRELLQA